MTARVKAIPKGYHAITPHLVVKDGNTAIAFYKKAFGAKEIARMPGPDGKSIMHSELQFGDSFVMLNDEFPQMGIYGPSADKRSPVTIHLYVDDVDEVFRKAIAEGAKETMPVRDQFWGDRYGKLLDPFGHQWSIATHIEDVPPDEMKARAKKAFKEFEELGH